MKRIWALACLCVLCATAAAAFADPALVTTANGPVRGTLIAGGTQRQFLAIPYAAPPAGARRWRPPQRPQPFSTPYPATHTGALCPQPGGAFGPEQDATNEDCLQLNVTAPWPAERAPVMVWIHGGSWTSGAGWFYNPVNLVARGIVVVTINYRLGIFGWLGLPALDNGTGNTANYGLEDTAFALRWVRDNIAAFGGDPHAVTIAGESAGGGSICALMASPLARGLFQRAIIESLPCTAKFQTVAQAEHEGKRLAADADCPGAGAAQLSCLRRASVATLLAAQDQAPMFAFEPSLGGSDVPVTALRQGLGRVPLLIGGNTLEMGLFIYIASPLGFVPHTPAEYSRALDVFYGAAPEGSAAFAARVAAQYPLARYGGDAFLATSTATSDHNTLVPIAVCDTWQTARLAARAPQPVYAYEFSDPNAPPVRIPVPGLPGGPLHSAELQYLWAPHDSQSPGYESLPTSEQPLAQQMVSYWTNFVKTGDPNGPGLPRWPRYATSTSVLQLRAGAVASGTDVGAEHHCGFWAEVMSKYAQP